MSGHSKVACGHLTINIFELFTFDISTDNLPLRAIFSNPKGKICDYTHYRGIAERSILMRDFD